MCTEFCGTSSFPLSFVHQTAIPVDFQLGNHHPPPSKVKISQSIAQFCSQGHRQEMDPSVPSGTPWNRKVMELGSGCHGEMEKHGTEKGNSSCSAQRLECRALSCLRWDRSPVPLAEQKQEQDNFKASPKTGSYLLSRHDFKLCIKAPALSFIWSVVYRLRIIQKIV